MGFGGNEMRVGFSRRVMGSIHARNNPGMLRPDHAVRENTRAAMGRAQEEHAQMPFGGGNVGDNISHSPGGSLRGTKSMAKSAAAAGDRWLSLKDARESGSGLDGSRPSRRDVRNAYRDYREMEKFSGLGSKTYGMKEYAHENPPKGISDSSTINQNPYANSPGPVMKKALPAARAAGKAVGKAKSSRAAKKAAKAEYDF